MKSMKNILKATKKLYKDALYYHLVRNGYTMMQAKREVKRVFNT